MIEAMLRVLAQILWFLFSQIIQRGRQGATGSARRPLQTGNRYIKWAEAIWKIKPDQKRKESRRWRRLNSLQCFASWRPSNIAQSPFRIRANIVANAARGGDAVISKKNAYCFFPRKSKSSIRLGSGAVGLITNCRPCCRFPETAYSGEEEMGD